MLVLAAVFALAGELSPWTGRWALDLEASDPIDAIMALQGYTWIERKAAASMSVTQVIALEGSHMTVAVRSVLKSSHEDIFIDGVARKQKGRSGLATVTHTWDPDGSIRTVATMADGDGCPCALTLIRTVSGDVLDQRFELVRNDGQRAIVRRVLRRVL